MNFIELSKPDSFNPPAEQNSLMAFEEIYDKYAPAIMGIITRIVFDKTAAGIILEKTFIEIWKTRQMYEPSKESFFIWIVKIARSFAMKSNPE